MISIARKNLFYDKIKFLATVIGIGVLVTLIFAQFGVYLGFMRDASSVIDGIDADFWVTSKNIQNFDFALPISEGIFTKIKSVKGVTSVEKLILTWAIMKLEDGGTEQIQIIGYNPSTCVGAPSAMWEGKPSDVKGGRFIIIDKSSMKRLGKFKVGDMREIVDQKVRVIGISSGVKSVTTSPRIYTAYKTAKILSPYVPPQYTTFFLIKIDPDADAEQVANRLRNRISGVDVFTKAGFSKKTRTYWTFDTGMGLGFLVNALLAFGAGIVVVGLTIYSSTMEHLRDFGTLKAIGAANRYIYGIIIEQAIISALFGYVIGLTIIVPGKKMYDSLGLPALLTPELFVIMFVITMVMCILASFTSIRKVIYLDPVMVFRA